MKLGTEVGLGAGHIVLDWNQAPQEGHSSGPHFSAHMFCGETAGWVKIPLTWYGGRPQPRKHCVIWEPTLC